jgi:uncharacterized protein (DUF433 family)
MTLPLEAEPPLRTDQSGTIRIGRTRVPLETVIHAFDEDATAEEIAYRFPSLNLADIYATITYDLRHPSAVKDYLREQDLKSKKIRRKIEARQPARPGLRERLLARRSA